MCGYRRGRQRHVTYNSRISGITIKAGTIHTFKGTIRLFNASFISVSAIFVLHLLHSNLQHIVHSKQIHECYDESINKHSDVRVLAFVSLPVTHLEFLREKLLRFVDNHNLIFQVDNILIVA